MIDTDPFGISKGKLPKPNTGFDRAQKIGGAIKRGARGVSNAAHNKTDRKGGTMFRGKEPIDDYDRPLYGVKYADHDAAGGRYARRPNGKKFGNSNRPPRQKKVEGSALGNFGIGAAAGSAAGSLAGDARHGGQIRQDYRQDRKVKKAFKVPKRPTLITTAGTKQGKGKWGDRPALRPGYLAAGAATGGVLSYTTYTAERKNARKAVNSTYRKQQKKQQIQKAGTLERYDSTRADRNKLRAKDAANVGAQTAVSTLGGISAIKYLSGHRARPGKKAFIAAGAAGAATAAGAFAGKYDKKQYRVKKRETPVAEQKKATGGRYAAGMAFPGLHGAVAGKQGKKLRAMGNEIGATTAGTVGGGLAGAAISRGRLTGLGAAAGSWGGAAAGVKRAQRKGQYQVQKNDSTSAFGVDHGY